MGGQAFTVHVLHAMMPLVPQGWLEEWFFSWDV